MLLLMYKISSESGYSVLRIVEIIDTRLYRILLYFYRQKTSVAIFEYKDQWFIIVFDSGTRNQQRQSRSSDGRCSRWGCCSDTSTSPRRNSTRALRLAVCYKKFEVSSFNVIILSLSLLMIQILKHTTSHSIVNPLFYRFIS